MQYRDYEVENIYGTDNASIQQEVIDFWTSNNVLPLQIAQQRVNEVVHIIRNAEGEIVGLNTAYLHHLKIPSQQYYYLRMFVRPQDRKYFGLLIFTIVKTFVFFRDSPLYREKGEGIVLAIENQKMSQKGLQKWFSRQGFAFAGKNEVGQDLWFARFDDPNNQDIQ